MGPSTRSQHAATRLRRGRKQSILGVTHSLAGTTPSFHRAALMRSRVMRFRHGAMGEHIEGKVEHIDDARELERVSREVIDATGELHGSFRELHGFGRPPSWIRARVI